MQVFHQFFQFHFIRIIRVIVKGIMLHLISFLRLYHFSLLQFALLDSSFLLLFQLLLRQFLNIFLVSVEVHVLSHFFILLHIIQEFLKLFFLINSSLFLFFLLHLILLFHSLQLENSLLPRFLVYFPSYKNNIRRLRTV